MDLFILFNVVCGIITACVLYGSLWESFPLCRNVYLDSLISTLFGLVGVIGMAVVLINIAVLPTTKFGFKIPFTK